MVGQDVSLPQIPSHPIEPPREHHIESPPLRVRHEPVQDRAAAGFPRGEIDPLVFRTPAVIDAAIGTMGGLWQWRQNGAAISIVSAGGWSSRCDSLP